MLIFGPVDSIDWLSITFTGILVLILQLPPMPENIVAFELSPLRREMAIRVGARAGFDPRERRGGGCASHLPFAGAGVLARPHLYPRLSLRDQLFATRPGMGAHV